MVSWEGINRRKFPRVNYPCLVVIREEGEKKTKETGSAILTHTDNVGIGGVCIVLKQNLAMYSKVKLELDLLDLGNHIKCNGKVVWVVQRQSGASDKPSFYDTGIEFIDIKPEDQDRLAKVVRRLGKGKP